MEQVQRVQTNPENHDPELHDDEGPTADKAGEVVGDAVGESLPALDFAVEVADGGVVVLVLDQVAGDVFDFTGD